MTVKKAVCQKANTPVRRTTGRTVSLNQFKQKEEKRRWNSVTNERICCDPANTDWKQVGIGHVTVREPGSVSYLPDVRETAEVSHYVTNQRTPHAGVTTAGWPCASPEGEAVSQGDQTGCTQADTLASYYALIHPQRSRVTLTSAKPGKTNYQLLQNAVEFFLLESSRRWFFGDFLPTTVSPI